jgi:hypothetical protein
MKTVADKLVKRVQHKGKGFSFTASDFLDLGTREAVDKALSSLTKEGKIRRVCRGVYDYPKRSELLGGDMAPDFDQVAQAIARNTGARIQPSEAVAASLLGLTDQVPAKIVYLTDGLSRTVKLGSQTITFQRTVPKNLLRNPLSARVVQALRFLGREAITDEVIAKLREQLTPAQRRRLLKDARYSTDWIAGVARRIANEQNHG